MTHEVASAIAATRRRLALRRALVLASALLPTAGVASLLILIELRASHSAAAPGVLAAVFGAALALAAALTWWTRPGDDDAARALDRVHGGGDVFLTAVTPTLGDASTFSALFAIDAERAAGSTSPAEAVRLPRTRGLALAAVLLFANALLVASPPADAPPAAVTEINALIARGADDPEADPELERLRSEAATARNEAELREVLDEHWRERRRARAEAAIAALTRALRDGPDEAIRQAARRAAAVDLSAARPEALAELADALAEAAADGRAARELLDAAASLREGDAAAASGIAAALGGAAPEASETIPDEAPYDAVEDLLIAAYSSLGTGPPESRPGAADSSPADAATTAGPVDDTLLGRFAARDRALLRRYLERRSARR